LKWPPIGCHTDWDAVVQKTCSDAEDFAKQVERLSEIELWENMADVQNGTY
jgi:hypothetical protein